MIVNPLTGKHIKANGKLAQKLLKMHRDKEVKLKRGDVKIIKMAGGAEPGDDPCTSKDIPKDIINKILLETDLQTIVKSLVVDKSVAQDAQNAYNKVLESIDTTTKPKDKLCLLSRVFGENTISAIASNPILLDLFKKITDVDITDEFYEKENVFIGLTNEQLNALKDIQDLDGIGKTPEIIEFADEFARIWVLRNAFNHISPFQFKRLLQKIKRFDMTENNGKAQSDANNNFIEGLINNDYIGDIKLDNMINFLKDVDMQRRVYIGI
jgi:hypothetical protein